MSDVPPSRGGSGTRLASALPLVNACSNLYYPREGSRGVSCVYDWTLIALYDEPVGRLSAFGIETSIQAAHVDNSQNPLPVTIFVSGSNQTIQVPAQSVLTVPLIVNGEAMITLSVTAILSPASGRTRVTWLNMPIASCLMATGDPSLDLNFVIGGPVTAASLGMLGVTAQNGTYFDQSGVLQSAANGQARLDFNPVTLACNGVEVEEGRTNSVRNPRCEGAVPGTPGTAPTDWTTTSENTGLIPNIIGTGTEQGIPYVDIQVIGTATLGQNNIQFDNAASIAASASQVWTISCYMRQVGGTQTNITSLDLIINDNIGGANSAPLTVTTAALAGQRQVYTRTLSVGAVTGITFAGMQFNCAAGAVNITLRFGAPQLELGTFATSVILPPPGAPAATTRVADRLFLPLPVGFNGTLWGTVVIATIKGLTPATNPRFIGDANVGSSLTLSQYYSAFGPLACGIFDNVTNVVTGNAMTLGVLAKFGTTLNGTAGAAVLNAGTPATGTLGSFAAMTGWTFGSAADYPNEVMNGWFQRIRYWPRALSLPDLHALTT